MTGIRMGIFSGGFFTTEAVWTALLVGGFAALVAAVAGVFTVMRGQSFAGHALADLGAVGGSGAFLLGVSQLWGFVGAGVLAAIVLEVIGLHRVRERDIATGIVFGFGLGLTALFLYLGTTLGHSSNQAVAVLFGSLFSIDPGVVGPVIGLGVLSLALVMLVSRWLSLEALDADIARARGVPVRLAGVLFMVALALAVELTALSIGAVLATALLIGPAACALQVTSRIPRAMWVAVVVGVGCTVLGIFISYESYAWSPGHRAWPASFCIVAIVFVCYLSTRVWNTVSAAMTRRRGVRRVGQVSERIREGN
ncbi:MAG: metal ABC transporter permease [Microbacteriaceae bacterium]|jgi:zinc/manganese transport system permease protein|nr:metal ABC transporter permease [Microbacteriaceae bacterium]MCI1207234.1 metal ABC transporter permease [Microbacteriaceae bacterium]